MRTTGPNVFKNRVITGEIKIVKTSEYFYVPLCVCVCVCVFIYVYAQLKY
jgi:hypothetical protein